jgi:hypothetical protein
LKVQPDTKSVQFPAVIECEGELVPVEDFHPAVSRGAGGKQLNGIRKAMPGFDDGIRLYLTFDQFPGHIDHEDPDHHAGGFKPVKILHHA